MRDVPALTRRRLLLGGCLAATGAAGVAATAALDELPWPVRQTLGLTPDPFIPDAPEGRLRIEAVASEAMGHDVELFTAVPAGHGDGAGLPVIIVLHGASASASDFQHFGLGRFVTAAVAAGAPPFVLAGTDDGPAGWIPSGSADPIAMLHEELPGWLSARGFDGERRAVWGWSRGGYGALRLALDAPAWASAYALFSPAVDDTDPALADLSALDGVATGVWCGTDDGFYDDVLAVAERLPTPPEIASYAEGGHTRAFWNDRTIDAFRWLSGHL